MDSNPDWVKPGKLLSNSAYLNQNYNNVLYCMDMSAIGWVMIAYSSNCLISQEWLASIAEGDSIINATLLYYILTQKSK